MSVRRLIAIWTAKIVSTLCRISGRQGATLAGKIALKVDPNILKDLSGQVREKIFVVCGTNGKTTTNNLLCSAIEAEGKKLVCNNTGSNMLQGIVSAFVLAAGLNGRLDADYACLEVDEASTLRIFPHVKPDYMVLTNLFRDQLDRYGEIESTMDMLRRAMQMVPEMTVMVNGDDPISSYVAMQSGNPYQAYGISEKVFDAAAEVKEGRFCQKCGAQLEYTVHHYSQLGTYRCPDCDFARPAIAFDASQIDLKDGIRFQVEGRNIAVNYRGFYNIYNILAAYSAARAAGLELPHYEKMLQKYNPQNGRMEKFEIGGTHVMLNLAKNPAGFNQNVALVMDDPRDKDVIVVINDNAGDGTDVSWLWDVDYDQFGADNVRSLTVCGIRRLDMQLRMKYVGVPCKVSEDVKTAIEDRLKNGCGNLYVLVNYTALFSTRELLAELQKMKAQTH